MIDVDDVRTPARFLVGAPPETLNPLPLSTGDHTAPLMLVVIGLWTKSLIRLT